MGVEAMQIMNIVKSLPLSEKIYIIELISKDLRTQTIELEKAAEKRKKAAQLLLDDYQNEKELTTFTSLDQEDFYEAK